MYVAIQEGYFEEEGIDLTLITGFGADKTMTAVLSGEAEIGFMGPETTVYTYNEGAQDYVVNFAQLTQRAGNFLVAREEIPDFTWEDLKGKNVLGGRKGGMPEKAIRTVDTFADAQAVLAAETRGGDIVLYENDLPDTFK